MKTAEEHLRLFLGDNYADMTKSEIISITKLIHQVAEDAIRECAERATVKTERNDEQFTSTTSHKDLYDTLVNKQSILSLINELK